MLYQNRQISHYKYLVLSHLSKLQCQILECLNSILPGRKKKFVFYTNMKSVWRNIWSIIWTLEVHFQLLNDATYVQQILRKVLYLCLNIFSANWRFNFSGSLYLFFNYTVISLGKVWQDNTLFTEKWWNPVRLS